MSTNLQSMLDVFNLKVHAKPPQLIKLQKTQKMQQQEILEEKTQILFYYNISILCF